MEEKLKQKVRRRMESIKDEVQSTGGKTVKDIAYYENVEVAGIQMNLYYCVSTDKEGKPVYELFNGNSKIGEGSKTGSQIKMDSNYMQEMEQKMQKMNPEYSLDEYGGDNIKLKAKDMEEKEVCKYSDLKKEEQEKGIILPGLEEEDEKAKEEQEKVKIEKELGLTKVQRISGKDTHAVLGEDKTKDYAELYVGYSQEAGTFVPVGVDGNKTEIIEGVKSYQVKQGGQEGKETYYMTSETDPYRGGIRIDQANGDLDVTVERRSEKDPNIIEQTKINDNGHTEEEEKQVDTTKEEAKQEEEDDRGEERVLGPRHYY